MNSPSETLREILEAVEGHGKYHTSAYDGPVMTVDQAYEAILSKLPEKKEMLLIPDDLTAQTSRSAYREGFNEALDTVRQILEGK